MIYLNNSSTTKPSKEVLQDFVWCSENCWANPSDISSDGLEAKKIICHAQEQVASYINGKQNEVVFTSGASESNNWAIKGFLDANNIFDCIITTKIEHPSVYNVCKYLEEKGYRVEYTPVNSDGTVNVDKFRKLISLLSEKHFCFVTIMMVNNELGSLNNIKEIAKITHRYQGYIHTDAVQAFTRTPIDVNNLGIDMMSVSFHKFNGFKNCGFLYIRDGIKLSPLIHGGHQFDGRRSGTENVAMIYALGNQLDRLSAEKFPNSFRRDYLLVEINKVCEELGIELRLNGSVEYRLPNILSLTFKGISAESLISLLDMDGVCVSAGSACSSGIKEPSKVLKAIGLSDEDANSTVRISLGHETTIEECDEFVKLLKKNLATLKMFI